jgi:DNA-binding phage protein
MTQTRTTRYDVARHLSIPEKLAAYFRYVLRERVEMLLSLPKYWEKLRVLVALIPSVHKAILPTPKNSTD